MFSTRFPKNFLDFSWKFNEYKKNKKNKKIKKIKKMKFLFDLFPIILFFIAFKFGETNPESATNLLNIIFAFLGNENPIKPEQSAILLATVVVIIATFLQIFWIKFIQKKSVDFMLWLSLFLIVIFGGLTLFFQNDTFIKWKPTLLYFGFAISLLVIKIFNKNPIKLMMQKQLELPEKIWTNLLYLWGFYFVIMGFLNIYIAYEFSTETWVNFKMFGSLICMFVLIIIHSFYISKYIKVKPEQ